MTAIIKNPNWWRKRTTLKRCRSLKSVFAGLALLSLVSGLAAELPAATSPKQPDVCYSAECLSTASSVLSKMNTEKDPCDDFYQYACGNYIKETHVPDGKAVLTTTVELSDKVQEQLEIVVKEPRPETDPKHLRLPNVFYKACTNTNLIESLGSKPIKQIAKRLGGWPVTDCECWDNDDSWTWPETVKKFRRFGFNFNYMLSLSIGVNSNNTNKSIINLGQCFLEFPREYLARGFTDPRVTSYYDYMVDMAVLLGADKETAQKELRKSLQFEMNLANLSLDVETNSASKGLHQLLSIKQMQKSYPNVQWLDYINALLPDGLTVEEDEMINVSEPSFFEGLDKLQERTNKRDIANYLLWRMHDYSADFLSREFRERKLEYQNALLGRRLKQKPNSKKCLMTVLSSLAISVDALYVRKYFRQDSKIAVLEITNNIRNVFSRMLNETEWMDDRAKREATKKLDLIKNNIGYPDELFNDNKLKKFYRKLHIDPDNYFQNSLRKNVFDTDNSFNELKIPVNASNWKIYSRPAEVNALYSLYSNSILFPAGILQGDFFNPHRPKCMNYGAIGSVIGHEITHGFIDRGGEFDGNGDPLDWWQNDTRQAYEEKAECVINQYGNYRIKTSGVKVDGIKTQVENIADIGGIKASYLAYNQWVAQHGEEQKLPGLNNTSKQLFWISSAQRWCTKFRENLKFNYFGVHAPEEFRVLGPFSNMNGFSRDFQCTNGTRLNPVKKCDVF